MTNKVTGRCYVTIRGVRMESEKGATCQPSIVQRTGQSADTGVAGFSEETVVPYIEASFLHKATVSVQALESITDEDIAFVTDTNVVFTLRHAWHAGQSKLQGGRVSGRFEGIDCIETGASSAF